jgi:Ca2+-binding RTX toxin-like protein
LDGARTTVSNFGDVAQGPAGEDPFGVALAPAANGSILQFSANAYDAAENGGNAKITVTRSGGANGHVSVDYTAAGGTATEGADYTFTSGTVSFGDGDATNKSFTVPIINDSDDEPDETVNLSLSNPDGGAMLGSVDKAVLTIADNDAAPITCAGVNATLVGTAGTDTLSGTIGADVIAGRGGNDVLRGLGGNDSICGGDGNDSIYGGNGTDTLAGGAGADQLFGEADIDHLDGGSGSDRCAAGQPVSGNTSVNCEVVVLPSAGLLQFSAANYGASEGAATARITVTRSGGANGAASVGYLTANGTATAGADYAATSGRVRFASGDAVAKSFTVPIINDARDEADETVKLSLVNPIGAPTGARRSALLTIADNDKPAIKCEGFAATIVGTAGADTLNGTSGADVIAGREGADVIRGRGGNDIICGGRGYDQLFGGTGRDQLFGHDGRDRLDGGDNADLCDGGEGVDSKIRCER